jgi:hypothetical protein
VRWSAPPQRPAWLGKSRWAALAAGGTRVLELRQVAFRVVRPGFRTRWHHLVTTLTDADLYPAEDLVELYGKRWQVEVYFRDLKRTLGLAKLSARSADGARREVLAFLLLYNLVRRVAAHAAAAQGVAADRVSFTCAAAWLLHGDPGAPLPRLTVNPRRPGRPAPPRRVKAARHRFPALRPGSRAALCKPAGVAKI